MRIRIHADKSELVGKTTGQQAEIIADPAPWPIAKVEVLDAPRVQKFTPQFLDRHIGDGRTFSKTVLTVSGRNIGDRITIMSEPPVSYKIVEVPGRYCCHSGRKLDDDESGEAARAHVASEHAGAASPDRENPAGYRKNNWYLGEKEGD